MTTTTQYPNWFNVTGLANFEKHLLPLAGRASLYFLQVGVFTGDASVWLLDNVLTGEYSSLVDVDTWQGSAEAAHEAFDWADVERVYDERVQHRAMKVKSTSEEFFADWGATFDFIYIDAAHDSYSVLNDAVDAYRHLKPGGLLAFDDYTWPGVSVAVDSFAFLYGERLEPVEFNGQAWFRRPA